MNKQSYTNDRISATQKIETILPELKKLRIILEETKFESDSLIQYANNHNIISVFLKEYETINEEVERIYGKK